MQVALEPLAKREGQESSRAFVQSNHIDSKNQRLFLPMAQDGKHDDILVGQCWNRQHARCRLSIPTCPKTFGT